MTLKTQGTINNSNVGQNFDSFDKSKLATNIGNQGNICSQINSAFISVNS